MFSIWLFSWVLICTVSYECGTPFLSIDSPVWVFQIRINFIYCNHHCRSDMATMESRVNISTKVRTKAQEDSAWVWVWDVCAGKEQLERTGAGSGWVGGARQMLLVGACLGSDCVDYADPLWLPRRRLRAAGSGRLNSMNSKPADNTRNKNNNNNSSNNVHFEWRQRQQKKENKRCQLQNWTICNSPCSVLMKVWLLLSLRILLRKKDICASLAVAYVTYQLTFWP